MVTRIGNIDRGQPPRRYEPGEINPDELRLRVHGDVEEPAAITAASTFERLHPRGPDGRFIEKFGFVRWFTGDVWHRGQVQDINPDGSVTVSPTEGPDKLITFDNPSKVLYALPRPKASLRGEMSAPRFSAPRPVTPAEKKIPSADIRSYLASRLGAHAPDSGVVYRIVSEEDYQRMLQAGKLDTAGTHNIESVERTGKSGMSVSTVAADIRYFPVDTPSRALAIQTHPGELTPQGAYDAVINNGLPTDRIVAVSPVITRTGGDTYVSHSRVIPGVGDVDTYLAAHPQQPGEPVFEWQSRIVDGLTPDQKHALMFEIRERYEPVDYLVEGMKRWRSEHGRPEPAVDLSEIPAPRAKADAVGRAFEMTPDQSDDPRVIAAFEEFKRQSAEMWDFLTRPESEGGLGVTVEFWTNPDPTKFGTGPYATATEQADDLRNNHHIFLESGLGGAHEATMTREEYDRFRAVHDVFGHAGVGGGFDRHGEYQAYLAHSSMYWDDGRRAMASEYHGVNAALWAGEPGSPGTGKSVLLPEELIPDPFDPVTGEIIAASAAQIPGPAQTRALSVEPETAEALAYLAEQALIGPDFARQYDSLMLHPHAGPPTSG